MNFVDDLKATWAQWSTWALATAITVQGIWLALPREMRESFPDVVADGVEWLNFAIVCVGLYAKHVKQVTKVAP